MLTDTDATDVVESQRDWLIKRASFLCKQNSRVSAEDLVQEGWLAMWLVAKKGDHELSHLWRIGHLRMVEVMRKNKFYQRTDAKVQYYEITADRDAHVWSSLFVEGGYSEVERDFHIEEVRSVLRELRSDRLEYVMRRFYGEEQSKKITQDMGIDPSHIWCDASVGVRQYLRDRLAHLAEV